MLAAVIWYGYVTRQRDAQIAALSMRLEEARTTNAELTARNHLLSQALALVNLPDARQLVFGSPDREPPRGRIWVHPQRGVLLLASRLPSAPAGKIYERWVVPKGAPPVPAGLFHSDQRGEAVHFWPQAVDLASTAAIAVTLEPEAGVPAPPPRHRRPRRNVSTASPRPASPAVENADVPVEGAGPGGPGAGLWACPTPRSCRSFQRPRQREILVTIVGE